MNTNQRKLTIRSLLLTIGATLMLTLTSLTGGAADLDLSLQRPDASMLWLATLGGDTPLASTPLAIGPAVRLNSPEGEFTGPEGISEFTATLHRSFSDLKFAATSTEAVDDLVIIRFTMTGINTGSYLNLPANCAAVVADGVAVLQFQAADIHEQWIGYDQSTLQAQIEGFNRVSPDSRPTCESMGIDQVAEVATDSSVPLCIRLNSCSFDSMGIEVADSEPVVVDQAPALLPQPTCMVTGNCAFQP